MGVPHFIIHFNGICHDLSLYAIHFDVPIMETPIRSCCAWRSSPSTRRRAWPRSKALPRPPEEFTFMESEWNITAIKTRGF